MLNNTTEMRGQHVELKPGMVSANNRNGMSGTADHLPTVYRAGAMDTARLPSRIGSRLYYRDGTVVDADKIQAEWVERDAHLSEEYLAGFDGPAGEGSV